MMETEKIWQELTEIKVQLARLNEQIENMNQFILGNGQEGLLKRVKKLEDDYQRRRGAKAFWEILRSVITFLVGGGIMWIFLGKK